MQYFRVTTHLSEIIEESSTQPVIIFKYSSECRSSDRLVAKLEEAVEKKTIIYSIYKVVVQDHPALSEKIEKHFDVKHESPQILIINHGKLTYTAHHNSIDIKKFIFE